MAKNGSRRPPLVADKRYSRPAKKTAANGKPRRRGARPPRPPRRRRPWLIALPLAVLGWMWRVAFKLSLTAAITVALLVGAGVLYYTASMPTLDRLVDGRARGSVTILDRNNEVFAWRGEQFGGLITVDNVSQVLKNAVVATEDKRFYRHFGISPRGVAGAIRINLSEGRGPLSGHGGSTITQQTAKLVCLGVPYDPASGMTEAEYEADCRETSLWRKVKEAVYAMALEAKFSKDEILAIYLNRAYLGAGANGFEAASQRYFGKAASEVDTSEAAVLAGALTAPTRYAPTNDLDRSWERALTVIKLMEEQGFLSAAEADRARNSPAKLSEAAEARAGGYFADWMMNTGPSFLTRDTTEDVFIRTTFDQNIQKAAEEALAWVFENKISPESKAQAAIVVMSSDGAVRAMVGGRKTQVTGAFNRATMALRQTGSAFKPFVYAAALDLGWRYDSIIEDAPITIDIPGSGPWTPTNYTNDFRGWVTLTDALANSLNIPAVKLSEAVGRENVRTVAGMFGIESDLALGPALALGASESTLLEMTGAYAGILNGGSSVTPYGLVELRLLGDDAPLMEQEGGIGERVITPAAAEQLIYMMHQVIERGSGQRANLPDREAAGKTGTTTAARDAWFLGFTADYVAGVWMGYDDNTPLRGTTGGGLPAEIWRETMVRVHEDLPPRPLPMIRPGAPPVVSQGTGGPGIDEGSRPRSPAPAPDSLLGVLRTILGIDN